MMQKREKRDAEGRVREALRSESEALRSESAMVRTLDSKGPSGAAKDERSSEGLLRALHKNTRGIVTLGTRFVGLHERLTGEAWALGDFPEEAPDSGLLPTIDYLLSVQEGRLEEIENLLSRLEELV